MSARKGFVVTVDVPCDGGVSPNAFKPMITAQLRLHFPPHTVSENEVLMAVGKASDQLYVQVREFFREAAEG